MTAVVGESSDPYEMWDAAYVLGSLSSSERRQYETHLSGCKRCRTAVSELSGMPALLALLDREDIADDGAGPADPPPLRPKVLESLLDKVSRRRRHNRRLTWTLAAAAAVLLALGVFVAARPVLVQPGISQQTTASAMVMDSVAPSSLSATVTLTSHGWGTDIDMACTYAERAAGAPPHEADDSDRLAMVAVGRDGSQTRLATWMAVDGVTALPSGSTSLPIEQIAAVQVVSADTGDVLLQKDL